MKHNVGKGRQPISYKCQEHGYIRVKSTGEAKQTNRNQRHRAGSMIAKVSKGA